MLGLRKSVVGIDLGTRHFKIAEIIESRDGIELGSFAIGASSLSRGLDATREIPVTNWKEAANSLRKLARDNSIPLENAYVAVSDQFLINRLITVPSSSDREVLTESVAARIKPALPMPLERWTWSWQPLGTYQGSQMILVELMSRSNQMEIEKIVRKAGFNPQIIDAACFNSFNLYHDYFSDEELRDRNIAFVTIGHNATTVCIIKNAGIRTIQTKPLGIKHFAEGLADRLGLSVTQGEELLKKEVVFLPEFVQEQEEVENYQHIKPIFGELVRSIFSLFEYHVDKYKETRIDRIVVTGGGANLKNIEIALAGHLNLERASAEAIALIRHTAPLSRELLNTLSAATGIATRR